MTDAAVPRTDVEAAIEVLQRHWDDCGGTRVHDKEPLLALRYAIRDPEATCPEYVVVEDDVTLHHCERERGHEGPHRVIVEWDA